MVGRIVTLAQQKFASNVIEKCLQRSTAAGQARIVRELSEPSTLGVLIRDQFANYVVQRALTVADDIHAHALAEAIVPFAVELKGSTTGRRILQRLANRLPEYDLTEKPE